MSKLLRCPAGILKFTLLALYLFALYELMIIPAILDWSFYGILLTLAIAGLLVHALPPNNRRTYAVLGVAFLMNVKALSNLTTLSWYGQTAGSIIIFFVLFTVSRVAGRVSLRRFLTMFLVALIISLNVNPAEVPLWTEYSIKWNSPVLYRQNDTVDYFPLQTADVNNDGKAEIITQGNFAAVRKEQNENTDLTTPFLQPEDNNYMVFAWNGQTFNELKPGQYSVDRLAAALQPDYINFPYYSAAFRSNANGPKQALTPLLTREELVEQTMRFGEAPFVILGLDLKSTADRLAGWPPTPVSSVDLEKPFKLRAIIKGTELTGTFAGRNFSIPTEATAILGAGRLLPGKTAQLVVLGEKLQVFSIEPAGSVRLINEISPAEVPDISTAEAILADINADGTVEVLLNTEYAKILKLTEDGRWQVLWASTDNSFRFEGFAPLGQEDKPHIIALAKSNVRNNSTRYMTGYDFTPAGLKQRWRVFSGLINLRAADVDGDKNNELIGDLYKKHLVLVLKKHPLPVVPVLYGLTAMLILGGFACQLRQVKKAKQAKLLLSVLLLAGALLGGCTYKSGPKALVPAEKPPEISQITGAREILTTAAASTTQDARKFWFQGWITSKIQKRKTNSMYNEGTFDRDKGFLIKASILQKRYNYYRWEDRVYVSEGENWRRIADNEAPPDPFSGFAQLAGAADQMQGLPDEKIMGQDCLVLQVKLAGREIARVVPPGVKLPASDAAQAELARAKLEYTIWIGKKDHFIYQYRARLTMPAPGAGTLTQETYFKFGDYNNPSVNLTTPDRIEPYLIK